MWEHPSNKKRRLERTAFIQSTKDKLPRNVVNKIFGYKEALNLLHGLGYRFMNNHNANKLATWLAGPNVNGMNSSDKWEFLKQLISRARNRANAGRVLNHYIRHLHLANSKRKLQDLLSLFIIFDERSSYLYGGAFVGTQSARDDTAKKLMKLNNTESRQKVLKLLERGRGEENYYEVLATLGNREEMIRALRIKLNTQLKETPEPKQRSLRKRKRDLNTMSTQNLKKYLRQN